LFKEANNPKKIFDEIQNVSLEIAIDLAAIQQNIHED